MSVTAFCNSCAKDVSIEIYITGPKRGAFGRAVRHLKCPECSGSNIGELKTCGSGHLYKEVRSGKYAGLRYCPTCRNKYRCAVRKESGSKPRQYIQIGDRSHTLKQWCKENSIGHATVRHRLRLGQSIEAALTAHTGFFNPTIGALFAAAKRLEVWKFNFDDAEIARAIAEKRSLRSPATNADTAWQIYSLSDPRDNAVRYIGFTTIGNRRLCGHVSASNTGRDSNLHKSHWIQKLKREGVRPVMQTIEEGAGSSWQSLESFWIAHFIFIGAKLVNLTSGGEGGSSISPSPQTREKLRKAMTGRVFTEEWKQRIAAAKKGIYTEPMRKALENNRPSAIRKAQL